jgi:hypothetical protein
MLKHAYLIMEHSNLPVAQTALRMIDDPRNEIFIYIDGKEVHESDFATTKAPIHFLHRHVDFGWGDFLPVEIALIKFAAATGHFRYYHLLSDCCLPIKSQDMIHDYFDRDSKRMIYLHVNRYTFKSIQRECQTNYPFVNSKGFRKKRWLKLVAKILVRVKILFGVNRLKNNKEIPVVYNGWQWFSIPDDFARFIVKNEKLLIRTFSRVLANEEDAFQSLGMNSAFRYRMYGYDKNDDAQNASKRMIKWNRKHWTPLVFTKDDYEEIVRNPNCFFARKFYADTDMEIVKMVEESAKGPANQ